MRRVPLKNNFTYHICSRSIAGYRIFRSDDDYARMIDMIGYYRHEDPPVKYSVYQGAVSKGVHSLTHELSTKPCLCSIIAYCLMPTHIHLILTQLKENGISTFMKNLLNSYSRYFNSKYSRKGPLWQGRFRSILVETDEQLLHLTRYIHLNPTSDSLVERPEDWNYSSYNEYLGRSERKLCDLVDRINLDPYAYKKFVESRQEYQRTLAEIKHLCLE